MSKGRTSTRKAGTRSKTSQRKRATASGRSTKKRSARVRTAKRAPTIGPLAMAYLISVGIHKKGNPNQSEGFSRAIRGALVSAYLDENSFVLFEDLPATMRRRVNCNGKNECEHDFRCMLADSGVLSPSVVSQRKTETPTGRRSRMEIGISRTPGRELININDSTKSVLPHNFYNTYYNSNTS